MSPLEQELRALGATLFPEEPDIHAAVRTQLVPRAGRPTRRPALALAALLLVALLAALAIPQARSALERWLGVGSARIHHVQRLPRATSGPLISGQAASVAAAERWIHHRLLYPEALGAPEQLRVDYGLSVVALRWRRPAIRLLEIESGRIYLEKLVGADTRIEPVTVAGSTGYWIPARHIAYFDFEQPTYVGPALLWQHEGITLRLDGPRSKAQAVAIARTVHS
jgi:hypothetical protein